MTLEKILDDVKAPKQIHFMSLDVEGAEEVAPVPQKVSITKPPCKRGSRRHREGHKQAHEEEHRKEHREGSGEARGGAEEHKDRAQGQPRGTQ